MSQIEYSASAKILSSPNYTIPFDLSTKVMKLLGQESRSMRVSADCAQYSFSCKGTYKMKITYFCYFKNITKLAQIARRICSGWSGTMELMLQILCHTKKGSKACYALHQDSETKY